MATQFSDSEFLSAADKAKIAKNWAAFVKGGFKRSQFTKALYKHLSLHYTFIAHYNLDGFYAARFGCPQGRMVTLEGMRSGHWQQAYADINAHLATEFNMAQVFADAEDQIRRGLKNEMLALAERLRSEFDMIVDVNFSRKF